MVISHNLPMVVVASFQRLYVHGRDEYNVLFEGKTQASPWAVTRWELTIRDHPQKGLVKYILERDLGEWRSLLRINGLGPAEETAFLQWALAAID
jgi:hypothetical protein